MPKCNVCQKQMSIDLLVKNRKYCKKCHSQREKERRSKLSTKVKQEQNRKNYQSIKKKIAEDPEYAISYWVNSWINTPREYTNADTRKQVSKDVLLSKCREAIQKFPYLKFNQGKEKWETPSVDRIDSSLPYSDNNIRVIPLWLNSAKLDMPEEKLVELMKLYLNCETHVL